MIEDGEAHAFHMMYLRLMIAVCMCVRVLALSAKYMVCVCVCVRSQIVDLYGRHTDLDIGALVLPPRRISRAAYRS